MEFDGVIRDPRGGKADGAAEPECPGELLACSAGDVFPECGDGGGGPVVFKVGLCLRECGEGSEIALRALIEAGEMRFSAEDLIAGDGWADELFDMRDDEVIAGKVIGIGPAFGVIHAVGEVACEDNLFAGVSELSESEGATEHAHVGVDTGKDHMLDAAGFEDIPDFITAVTEIVVFCINLNAWVLRFPRECRVAAFCGKLSSPFGMFCGIIIFATV
jgi:hypothetical protein